MPSQSVEAATRNEAIAAAREEFGPTARVVGVRRIRSGGMFGFFANERYIAEVEVPEPEPEPEPGSGPDTGSVLKAAAAPAGRPAASLDDRMRELADLLGAAQETPSAGLYGRSGAAPDASAPRPAPRTSTAGRSAAGSAAGSAARSAGGTPKTSRAAASPSGARPFKPTRHTLMLSPDELAAPAPTVTPAAEPSSGPSPFAAALTRMVASNPVQAAADAAAEAAAAEAAATEAAAADAAAAQVAATDAAAAEAARVAAARIDAAAAEAARQKAEATAAEAARLKAEAAAAEATRLRAAAAAAEAARVEAEAAAAEAARLETERLEAARAEAERVEAERVEAERVEAERAEAERAEAARVEAERVEAERVEAERVEAERVEAERVEAERVEAERVEAARVEAERVKAARQAALRQEAARQEAARIEAAAAAELARLRDQAVAADAPLTMVESVRTADEQLAALLEEVLAANGSGRGRHRLPEAFDRAGAAAGATAVATATVADQDRVLVVPQPWAYETHAPETSAYDTGAYRTDPTAGQAWTSDARVAQRAAQVAASQNLVVDAVVVDESPAEEERYVDARPVDVPVSLAPAMARTASDAAPLPLDATMILPALSLLPPQRGGLPALPGRPAVPPVRRGRPPVPPARPAAGRPQTPTAPVPVAVPIASRQTPHTLPATDEPGGRLATVTRLVPPTSSTALAPFPMSTSEELVLRLLTLGLPDFLLGADFADDAAQRGVYAALTRTLAERLPTAPHLPMQPGEVLMVVGPGAETFAAARSLAVTLRLEPEDVQWAASGALAGLAPEPSRITSLETAAERQAASAARGSVTVIAVDAALRTSGGPWLEHMLSIWSPTAVWAVLDSTRKPEDLVPWLAGLPRLDAVVVQDTDATADPAAVLSHVSVPVALVDGVRATAHRWASLLCERLEEMDR